MQLRLGKLITALCCHEVIAKFTIQAAKNAEHDERTLTEGAPLQLANLRRRRQTCREWVAGAVPPPPKISGECQPV
jgi:hypothetical protein